MMAAIEMVSVLGEQAGQKTPIEGEGSLARAASDGSESFQKQVYQGWGSGVLPIGSAPELI
jgi:hypothetical protein